MKKARGKGSTEGAASARSTGDASPNAAETRGVRSKSERQRNKTATREAILKAARTLFARRGLENASLREITIVAGVNESLVNRYFGSKLRLFAEAVLRPRKATRDAPDTQAVGEIDPHSLSAIVLSTASGGEARAAIKMFLQEQAIGPLAARMPSDRAGERAAAIISFTLGLHIMSEVFEVDALAGLDARRMQGLRETLVAAMTNGETR